MSLFLGSLKTFSPALLIRGSVFVPKVSIQTGSEPQTETQIQPQDTQTHIRSHDKIDNLTDRGPERQSREHPRQVYIHSIKGREEYYKEVSANRYLVVDCFTTWCTPCRLFEPKLQGIVDEMNKNLPEMTPERENSQTLQSTQQDESSSSPESTSSTSSSRMVKLVAVDVEKKENQHIAEELKVNIVPTIFFLRNGKIISSVQGIVPDQTIEDNIKALWQE